MTPLFVSAQEVARLLPYEACIPLMREAMIALSAGRTRQLLRSILDLPEGRAFGAMLGAMEDDDREGRAAPQPAAMSGGHGNLSMFGAKLISVYPHNLAHGGPSHQGVIVLFDPASGAPSAIVEAGEVTAIRTAAASAAATDALARADAATLAVLGTGEQARRHVAAIRCVRRIERITIWGRDRAKAEALAAEVGGQACGSVAEAVREAAIVCTVTGAADPILASRDVTDGAHVNAVGSSRAGPAEIANDLVARARFFADHEEGVRAQGAEFLNARAAGLIGEAHLRGEIGAVFAGTIEGRRGDADVTLYKSLGSIVQDLAAARHILARLRTPG